MTTDPFEGPPPPHDRDAEEAILGACLLSANAIGVAAEHVHPDDFYYGSMGRLFAAIVRLWQDNTAVDEITVAAALEVDGTLEGVGGRARLAVLAARMPAAGNVAHYAEIVRGLAVARDVIRAGAELTRAGLERDGRDAAALVEHAESLVFDMAQRRQSGHDFVPAAEAVMDAYREIEAIHAGQAPEGLMTGFSDVDRLLAGIAPGALVVIAGRPSMGKTALVLGLLSNLAVHRKKPCALFTLEMSKKEVMHRLLAIESGVDTVRMRTGDLHPSHWEKLTDAANRIERSALYVDDASLVSMGEIRSKARRLKLRHPNLACVVVDYLQLMTGGNAESRQQEIAAISRAMKVLARELEVPVFALSQLSRQVEQRHDKRPLLSDLRECVPGSALVYDPRTGARVAARDLAAGSPVASLTSGYKIVASRASAAWSTGVKPVVRIRTRTGRTVRCSAGHRLLTVDGWIEAKDLRAGAEIAVPRRLPAPRQPAGVLTPDEARLIGYLISDGSYARHRSVSYAKADRALVSDVARIARERFGIDAKVKPARQGIALEADLTVTGQGRRNNPLIAWLRDIGIHGQLGHEKRVPAAVFRESNDLVAAFVGALWAGDGTVMRRCLRFVTASEGLASDLQHLLTRLGVIAFRSEPYRNTRSKRDLWSVSVSGAEQIEAFRRVVPVPGEKGDRLAALSFSARRNDHVDRMPLAITETVAAARVVAGMSHTELGYRTQGKRICRADLAAVAANLADPFLAALAASEVLWDPVVAIDPDGEEDTYDLTVPGHATYVVDDVVSHNSGAIEQDADQVWFVYRDAYYNPEAAKVDQTENVAELIVAKNRNGPDGTVRLSFLKRLARFGDLVVLPGVAPPEGIQ